MRRLFADHGVPQPRFAAVHDLHDSRVAAETVGFPAVLKPANSGGQRGLFRLESVDDLDAHLHCGARGVADPGGDPRGVHGGARAERDRRRPRRRGDRCSRCPTACGRRAPASASAGSTCTRRRSSATRSPRPSGWRRPRCARSGSRTGSRSRSSSRRLGRGASPSRWRRGSRAARWPTSSARAPGSSCSTSRSCRRSASPCPTRSSTPSRSQPLAVRFLTAEPGPLPAGTVTSFSGLERVLASPGVVQAEVYFTVGETIRPVRLDGDRRGYVLAIGDTNLEALERAEAAARLLESRSSEMCGFDLDHYGELLAAAETGGYRFAFFDHEPRAGRPLPAPRRRPLARGGARALGVRARARRPGDVLPDDDERLLQPRLARGRGDDRAAPRRRAPVGLHAEFPALGLRPPLRPRRSPGTTPTRRT